MSYTLSYLPHTPENLALFATEGRPRLSQDNNWGHPEFDSEGYWVDEDGYRSHESEFGMDEFIGVDGVRYFLPHWQKWGYWLDTTEVDWEPPADYVRRASHEQVAELVQLNISNGLTECPTVWKGHPSTIAVYQRRRRAEHAALDERWRRQQAGLSPTTSVEYTPDMSAKMFKGKVVLCEKNNWGHPEFDEEGFFVGEDGVRCHEYEYGAYEYFGVDGVRYTVPKWQKWGWYWFWDKVDWEPPADYVQPATEEQIAEWWEVHASNGLTEWPGVEQGHPNAIAALHRGRAKAAEERAQEEVAAKARKQKQEADWARRQQVAKEAAQQQVADMVQQQKVADVDKSIACFYTETLAYWTMEPIGPEYAGKKVVVDSVEHGVLDDRHWLSGTALYKSYTKWCSAHGKPQQQKKPLFVEALVHAMCKDMAEAGVDKFFKAKASLRPDQSRKPSQRDVFLHVRYKTDAVEFERK